MTSTHIPRFRTAARKGASMLNGSVSGANASGQKPPSPIGLDLPGQRMTDSK
jgi:hypothetical protein